MTRAWLAALLAVMMASRVLAATTDGTLDYKCLSLCTANKGTSQSCLKSCTYGRKLLPPGVTAEEALNTTPGGPVGHNQFAPLLPAPAEGQLSQRHASVPVPQINYQCLGLCEKTGEQFAMCEQQCAVESGHRVGGVHTSLLPTSALSPATH